MPCQTLAAQINVDTHEALAGYSSGYSSTLKKTAHTRSQSEVINHNGGTPSRNQNQNPVSVSPFPRPRPLLSHQSTTGGSTPSRPKWRRYLSKLKWFLADQWFLLALGFFILLASQVQVPGTQQATKELFVTYFCVTVIFLITGCTLPTKVLFANYSRWKIHLFVQLQSFLLTSAIVFAVVSLCATNPEFMDPGLLVGMIFMGCVPTTISSNLKMTKEAKGNQALTVVESTLGNFLGPFISPPLILMYTSTGAWYTKVIPGIGFGGLGDLYKRVFKQLGLSMFLPLVSLRSVEVEEVLLSKNQVAGQIIQNLFPKATHRVFNDWKLSKLGSWSLLIIIWQTFDQAFETHAFESVKANNITFIVFMSLVFYTLWTITCFSLSRLWLDKADTIAVAYIVPAKTPAMGVPLSNVMFAGLSPIVESKLQIPLVIFQGLQIATGSLLTIGFRKWIGDVNDGEAKDIEMVQEPEPGS